MKKIVAIALTVASTVLAQGAEFSPLFNGKDFTGWWGCGTENPAKWMALSEADLKAKKAKSMENIKKHPFFEGIELENLHKKSPPV